MTSVRSLALGSFTLSLVGLAAGITWATVAFLDDGEQGGVGILFGLALAVPTAVLVVLSGLALALHRSRPGTATTLLTVAGTGVLVLAVSVLSLFAPGPR